MVTIREFAGIYDDSIIVKWFPHDDNPDYDKYADEDFDGALGLYYKSTRDLIADLDAGNQPFTASAPVNEVYFDDGWFCMNVFEQDYIESWTY